MKIFHKAKDGGPLSTVTGYWLIEAKRIFSIALLKFENGSRDQYHSHAFGSISWVLGKGRLTEEHLNGLAEFHKPGFKPIVTKRSTFHRVFSSGVTWVLTLRGPWAKEWSEYDFSTNTYTLLKDNRVVVASYKGY